MRYDKNGLPVKEYYTEELKTSPAKKMRALDSEMVKLQRTGMIKYFYYPAISYLLLEDAKKGVHGNNFGDLRDMKFY